LVAVRPPVIRAILVRFAISRLVLFGVATFAVSRLPIDAVEAQGFHLPPQSHPLLEAWARYDACWYVAIARHGYVASIGPEDMRAAFFPLFPTLIALFTPIVREPMVAGLVVSNACYLAFLLLLFAIVERRWGDQVADAAVWTYLLFPSAFFLSGAYSESVLLVMTAGALLLAMQRRWLAAGVLVACAALTRPLGGVAIIPVLAEYLATTEEFSLAALRRILPIVLPVAATAALYLLFAWRAFGNPFAILDMEAAVRGSFVGPWQPFTALWDNGRPHLHAFNSSLVDAALALGALAALPLLFAGGPPGFAWYALLLVLVPLSESLMSFNRLVLPSFPHAILLARVLDRPWRRVTVLTAFAILQAVWMAAFATWHWVA
jgi:mannosyltransferase PIG-V